MLFDAEAAAQAGRENFSPEWFDAAYWRERGLASDRQGGRGGVIRAHVPTGDWLLRHYRRGGMAARLMGDRYLWNGSERTRGFAEFRLLAELQRRGLNVPAPVAARYRRSGAHYRADLITRFIVDTETLAERLHADTPMRVWRLVGTAIAEFHVAGAFHADLNAHNKLLDATRRVWLIDFDRGELRAPAHAWQMANLARLRRSLVKLGAARDGESNFDRLIWQPLMAAYERRSGESIPGHSAGSR